MGSFPDPIPLPDDVSQKRSLRRIEMSRMVRRGVFLRSFIILAELVGYAFFESSTLLLDALSSLFDIASSLFLLLCIKLAAKPPDRNHPFGHGRFEPIGGVQLSLLLVILGGALLFQQVTQIFVPHSGQLAPLVFIIPLCGAFLLEVSYFWLKSTATKQHSPALMAEALHYRMDALTNLIAAGALLITFFFPKYSLLLDHVGAATIAGMMVIAGVIMAKKNVDQLLDRIPDKKYFQVVREAAEAVEGVLATEKLKIQLYGPNAHVNIDIEVDPELSVEASHLITQKVRASVQSSWPEVQDVMVHVEPYYPNDHEVKD